jgi:quinol monooxygenase YgiN
VEFIMMRIVWRFRVKPEKAEEFQRVYSWKGKWAKLFGRSAEYQGTLLLQDRADPLVFVVIDRWAKMDSFVRFRQQFGPDYDDLDQQCTDLTVEEALIGEFRDEPV